MDNLQAAVYERMRQAVGRLVRDGAGDALNGEIVLRVVGGELVDVKLPSTDAPQVERAQNSFKSPSKLHKPKAGE